MFRLQRKDAPTVMSGEAGPQTVAGRDPKPALLQAVSLLVITNFPERFVLLGTSATVVSTCREGMELLDQTLFAAIFCDMGQLAEGESGFRFAHALKKREGVPPIFLMTEQVTVYDEQWAKRQGAEGLIPRTLDAMQGALTGLKNGAVPVVTLAASAANAPIPAKQPIAAASLDRVKLGLRRHIGPVADDMVHRTLASISKRHPNGVSLEALATAVSHYIEDTRQRDRFLEELGA